MSTQHDKVPMLQALRHARLNIGQLLRALKCYAGAVQECCGYNPLEAANTFNWHAEAELGQALLHTQLILQQLVLEDKVLLEAVAPAHLLVVMDDAVVKVHICPLLVLIIGCLGVLMPLDSIKSSLKCSKADFAQTRALPSIKGKGISVLMQQDM